MLVAMPTSAARRLVVPIKLLSLSSERQECRRVWQMNKWATCGSLLLNMQQLRRGVVLSSAIRDGSAPLPRAWACCTPCT